MVWELSQKIQLWKNERYRRERRFFKFYLLDTSQGRLDCKFKCLLCCLQFYRNSSVLKLRKEQALLTGGDNSIQHCFGRTGNFCREFKHFTGNRDTKYIRYFSTFAKNIGNIAHNLPKVGE